MRRRVTAIGIGVLVLASACDVQTPSDPPPPDPSLDIELRQALQQSGVFPIAPLPEQDPRFVELGRLLVFDKILSGNRDIACATCHHPSSTMADGLSLSIGTGGTGLGPSRTLGPGRQFVPRNAPTLLNSGLGLFYMFWDGRVRGARSSFDTPAGFELPPGLHNIVAAQAMFPVVNRREMRGEPGDLDVSGNLNELAQFRDEQFTEIWRAVMRRVLAVPEYEAMFTTAFPFTPTSALGFQHAAAAIAAFELQALTKTDSPFDRYLARDDAALTAQAKRGALLFFGKAGCASCHNGPLLGGQGFSNTGVPQLGPGTGRGAPLDFGFGDTFEHDFYRFSFRVAPLRNVELTAPYTHDGAYATLEAVVRHYSDVPLALRTYDVSQLAPPLRGTHHGDQATIDAVLSTLDGQLREPLGLTDAEIRDIVTFLKSLTDPAARDLSALRPARVPSGLPVPQ